MPLPNFPKILKLPTMQFTQNLKDRHRELKWCFDNVNQRINDKVAKSDIGLSMTEFFKSFRYVKKQEFKSAYSRLRKARKILDNNQIYITVVIEPFKLL